MDENLTRALRSGLYVVERNLNSLRGTLLHADEGSVLYSTKDDIGSELKRSLLATISSMLEEIKLMKEAFALQTQEETVRRRVYSYLSENWGILHECKPERIQRYGKLAKQEKEVLDHHIDKLLAMNDALQRMLFSR